MREVTIQIQVTEPGRVAQLWAITADAAAAANDHWQIVEQDQEIRRGANETTFVLHLVVQFLTSAASAALSAYISERIKGAKAKLYVKDKLLVEPTAEELAKILESKSRD